MAFFVKLKDIFKSYEDNRILDGVNLTLAEDGVTALLGPSGCGKTTLLNILAGLTEPDSGEIIWKKSSPHRGYMLQKDLLFPWLTVRKNILLHPSIHKNGKQVSEKMLDDFGLRGFEDMYPSALSGGMRQRAALLRTYLSKPEILLLDEPFANLDAITKEDMQKFLLEKIRENPMPVLLVTHDIDEALLLADRITVMSRRPGRILAEFRNKRENPEMLKKKIRNLLY